MHTACILSRCLSHAFAESGHLPDTARSQAARALRRAAQALGSSSVGLVFMLCRRSWTTSLLGTCFCVCDLCCWFQSVLCCHLPEKVLGSWLTHLRVRGWKHLRVESRASVLALASGVRTDAVSGLIKSIARRMTQTTSKNTCRQDTRLDDPRCAMWHVPCVRECVIPHTSLSV